MALGKGLGSLIPPRNNTTNIKNQAQSTTIKDLDLSNAEVSVSEITLNPHQPRRHFHHQELEDLINSIKQHGILQPLIVSATSAGYELIAGERRLKAAKIAGLKKVPVVIRQASDLEKLELALIENIQRSDLNPIEKAEGYKKLVEEFGLTQEQAAAKVGISRSAFTNILRLLNLSADIQKALADGKITEGHAKVLLSLEGNDRKKAFAKIISRNLSVRDLEQDLDNTRVKRKKAKRISYQDPQINAWQEELSQVLSTKVSVKKKGHGGVIVIEYYSPQELKKIIQQIKQ